MAVILQFACHASAACLKSNAATSTRSLFAPAQRENTQKYPDGITPAAFQLLTAGGPTPNRLATAVVPPKASMIESTVFNIPQHSSDCLKMSRVQCGAVDFNENERINNEMDSKAVIGERIDIWLEAVGKIAAEVCRDIDQDANAFSQWKNGVHRLPLEVADEMCRLYKLTMDWIYRGDLASIANEDLRKKINDVTRRRRRILVS
jgi:hypothetical protein